MSNLKKVQQAEQRQRQNRYFSDQFKRQKVKEIENNLSKVSEICREYEVSRTAVYKWIYKYSNQMKKGVKQIVEAQSDTKKIAQLKGRIKELEQIIGQKQLMIDFQEKLIEIVSEDFNVDVKKKYGSKPLSGSGGIEKGIDGK